MNIIPTTTTTSDIHQHTFTRNHTTTITTIKSKRSSGRNLLSLLVGGAGVLYLFLLLVLVLLPYPMVVNCFRLSVVLSRRSPPYVLQKEVLIRYSRIHHPNSFLDTNPINPYSSYSRSSSGGCCISRSTSSISSNISRIGIISSTSKTNTSSVQQQLFATSSPGADLSPPQEEDNEMKMYHLDCIGSTQDEARRILQDDTLHVANTCVAITAASQTHGRGTNNRTWIGKRGNTFLTVAVPSDNIQIPVSLLPLQIGVILAENVNEILYNHTTHAAKLTLKWPNDVLINNKKVAGVLIESEKDHAGNYYFLIGIGINYKFAPNVQSIGPERGREATCICDYLDEDDSTKDDGAVEEAKALGIQVAKDIQKWIELQKIWDGAAEDVVTKWENWAKFGQKLVLRDTTGNETVIPLRVEKDGRLRVQGQDGRERLLCFDYLL